MGTNAQLTSVCPRFTTVAAINAAEGPAFILPLGMLGNSVENCPSVEEGWVGKFIPGWNPGAPAMGNRWYMGIAYFELGGKSYIVRNYITPEFSAAHMSGETEIYSKWKSTLNFAVYEYNATANTAKIVGTWQGSEFSNGAGMGTLTAEVVDDKTVNIYTYGSTGSAEPATGTVAGVYCAMVKMTLGEAAALEGEGTEASPYQITKPADVEAMKDLVSADKATYFKLMNDIDMTGINHMPTVGNQNKDFGKTIYFDGNNHVISNLKSHSSIIGKDENENDVYDFYYASLFGVFQGEVKNLGLVDVDLKSTLGVAGIGAYVGYGSDKGIVDGVIDNCYVTGSIECLNSYAGGLMGTTSATATITNSYA
ncbi:MAG: hypothetical protein K2J07_06960, partial [Muribaculaceae bacterium]|nr:hypothetical protein [Muribaculaceae bacterium]